MISNRNGETASVSPDGKQAARVPIPARRSTAVLLAGYAGLALTSTQALAQGQPPAATIHVASQLRLNPGAESKLEISVAPKDAIPPRALIVIRGVPTSLRLSEGRPFGPGVWVVQAAQTLTINLQMPAEARVSGDLRIALTTLEGVSIAEAQIALMTAAPAPEPAATAASPAGPHDTLTSAKLAGEQQVPRAAPLTAEKRAELLMLLAKGKDSSRQGNILHARQFYLRAAEKGLAEAALALAATYDAGELSRMKGITGVVPDAGLARKWYEKATQLGSPEAESRLSELSRP